MRTVTLQNLSNRALVVVLDHAAFRDKTYGFTHVKRARVDKLGDGTIGTTVATVAVPGSVSLPPRGEVSGLHPAIANCAQVRNWLDAMPPIVAIKSDPSRVPPPTTSEPAAERRARRPQRGQEPPVDPGTTPPTQS